MPSMVEYILIVGSLIPLVTFVVLLLIWGAVSRSAVTRAFVATSLRRFGPAVACITAGIILAAFVAFGFWYSRQPGFASEVEPLVTSISSVFHHGGELYHAPDDAQRYSVLYGPSVYLATGLSFLMFGLSITAAKTGALLALLSSLGFLFLALRRHVNDGAAFVLTGVATLLLWTCGTSAFVVRPDVFLLLGVGFGLWTAGLHQRVLAMVGTALAYGFVVNLKIHAGLYMLPVLAMLDARHGWRAVVVAVGAGTTLALAPFAFHPGISPNRYLEWILISTRHGLEAHQIPVLVRRSLLYAIPVLVPLAAGARFPGSSRLRRNLGLAWLIGNLSVIVLALKPGAGLVHLLPLVPINIVSGAMLWIDRRHTAPNLSRFTPHWRLGVTTAFLVTALIAGAVTGYRSGMRTAGIISDGPAVAADVAAILDAHPGRTMGMGYGGEGASFRHTYQRPLLTFADQPLMIDAISQMDAQRAHVKMSQASMASLDAGVIDIWLIPAGQQPFEKMNWYPPHESTFPPEYVACFHRNYALAEHTRFFDLWSWHGSETPISLTALSPPTP